MGSIIVADRQIKSYDIHFIGYPNSLVPFGAENIDVMVILCQCKQHTFT
jgi:hypothetical protein